MLEITSMESDCRGFIAVLKHELIAAQGCTEPIAVAFASAKAVEVLGQFPESMIVRCSGNIIKNVKGVTVPNSDGMKGIDTAAVLGAVGGNASRELEVLSEVTEEDVEKTRLLIKQGFCECRLAEGVENLYIEVSVSAAGHSAVVEVSGFHTHISRIAKDGAEIERDDYISADSSQSGVKLSVRSILDFVCGMDIGEVEELLKKQIEYNCAISDEGLKNPYGSQIGRIILETEPDCVETRAKARAAAGSDARMSGCTLPAVIISGSGNQGITVTLPIVEYARHLNAGEEKLYRALAMSNLIGYHIKKQIGSLSAFCGTVSASCGVAAGITYLYGGSYEQICGAISNTLGNVGGMVCDGAKPSCAAKIASSVGAAILGHKMAMRGLSFKPGEGIISDDIEETISAFAYVAREGMRDTDVDILRIMTHEIKV